VARIQKPNALLPYPSLARAVTITAGTIGAALLLGGCAAAGSGLSAMDYAANQEQIAQTELDEAHIAAQEAADAHVANLKAEVNATLNEIGAALALADVTELLRLSDTAVQNQIHNSPVTAAWRGTGDAQAVPFALPPIQVARPVVDARAQHFADAGTAREVFGDAGHVPTVNGRPWTEWAPPALSRPGQLEVFVQFADGSRRCLTLADAGANSTPSWLLTQSHNTDETVECGLFTQVSTESPELVAANLMIGQQSIADVVRLGTVPALIGDYELAVRDGFSTENITFDTDLTAVNIAEPISLVATDAMVERAISIAEEWMLQHVNIPDIQLGTCIPRLVEGIETQDLFGMAASRSWVMRNLGWCNHRSTQFWTVHNGVIDSFEPAAAHLSAEAPDRRHGDAPESDLFVYLSNPAGFVAELRRDITSHSFGGTTNTEQVNLADIAVGFVLNPDGSLTSNNLVAELR